MSRTKCIISSQFLRLCRRKEQQLQESPTLSEWGKERRKTADKSAASVGFYA